MSSKEKHVETVRASRAGHTFHERWAARRALQLVFPKDDLFAVVIEGLSPCESLKFSEEAEDIADLILFYGEGDTFETCSAQQTLQFKYKEKEKPVTSSYLKKTIKKFAVTLRDFRENLEEEKIKEKLSFGFVTNADFSDDLWDAILCLKSGGAPKTNSARKQMGYLESWCQQEKIKAVDLFPLIEFRASTSDLPAQNRSLRRTVSDWSADSAGQAAKRLFALVELVREKAQIEGQGRNSIRREDILDALECDEDQLFPADTRFVAVGDVVERSVLKTVEEKIGTSNLPVFLEADGGVGKTVFVQSLALHLENILEVVVFDCFGGGEYRSESQARHLPRVGLLQIVNELATRGLCDPLLPTDSDQYGLIEVARKRLKQASTTVKKQSAMHGILIILDAADNAQLEANARGEVSFPRLLLASLSVAPIEGVNLLLTARPHRADSVIARSPTIRLELEPFTEEETRRFLETRREKITDLEFSTAVARSRGNARVLEYLVESWDINVSGNAPQTKISVEELIAQKCATIFRDLHTVGWSDTEVREFFAALSLLPPPIPLTELAEALECSESQVNSAAADLAPMLELVKHGAIFRDEPTETYIKDQYASEVAAQQSIAERLQARQKNSIYAAEALPHFLVVIGDSNRAYRLAASDDFPTLIESEHGRRRLKLVRLHAAFSLATRDKDLDRILSLTMQLSQAASANARGDQFIRRSPALATVLGDSDATRRLFKDRSGWRGARDARLIVAYSFTDELDEARIHRNRAIGWLNWSLRNNDEAQKSNRSGFKASDIAAVMFLSVLDKEFSSFNRQIQMWRFEFALLVVEELISLCAQHELSNESDALQTLVNFAASNSCFSIALQVGLLSKDWGLAVSRLKSVSRAASALSEEYKKKIPENSSNYEMELQVAISSAALTSTIVNSKRSAKRLFNLHRHRRPSEYDYGERHGMNRIWVPVQSACVAAWSSSQPLSFHHLMPEGVKTGRKTKSIKTEAELSAFLDSLFTSKSHIERQNGRSLKKRKQFSEQEQRNIVKGAACVLTLVKPVEVALLSRHPISSSTLAEFLIVWKSALRPDLHWNFETGTDSVARFVGIGLAKILLRHCERIEKEEAQELVEIIGANRFTQADKLSVLALIASHSNLADVTGTFANSISSEILKDDYIEQRGDSFRELAGNLIPISIQEAKAYYVQGLAQLDQMGGNDFDLIYSILHYAAKQPGGYIKPEASHRLMNLCQTIFHHEPSKFGWTLFARAASSSIGYTAMYKLVRWSDQDVVDHSFGLPQLACYLAKAGSMDPRRAAILLTVCEDHGWHEWQVGDGLSDLLSVTKSEDRQAIVSLVTAKLFNEHNFGGWEGIWRSLLECADKYGEVCEIGLRDHLERLKDSAIHDRNLENARNSSRGISRDLSLHEGEVSQDDQAREEAFAAIFNKCDPTSAPSLDEAILEIQASEQLKYDSRKRLFDELRTNCPYANRIEFLEALFETTELEFDSVLNLMIECVEAWRDNTMHIEKRVPELIRKLFGFKGSELFDLRYSGISRQIYRLSKLCGDPKFVLQTVLETIAKERLELEGDEWLQIATVLCCHTDPSTASGALEGLLGGAAAKIGDEIGEGPYRDAFAGPSTDGEVVADIIWHLLGDSDAFVRWSAARSIEGMLDIGLVSDVDSLLDRFDLDENKSLASKEHNFASQNAQQWLLMGLARAALRHGEELRPLKQRLVAISSRPNIHALNKIHVVRCLTHIENAEVENPKISAISNDVRTPARGVVVRPGQPTRQARRIDFKFDYEFNKTEISDLARLFGISQNEASDYIAEEVIKRWPKAKGMSDFPGGIGHSRRSGSERFESYREHIQRHALIHAATKLANSRPVVRDSYDRINRNPWREFLSEMDVSFEDGSWLSDNKDPVPRFARHNLLGERNGDQETLVDNEELFQKIGLSDNPQDCFLPLYGEWRSVDGVYVRFLSALIKTWGAVGQCVALSKKPAHDLWLPTFGSDGRIDRFVDAKPLNPLICESATYPIGIDEGDEWAARGAIGRPRLGAALVRILNLSPDSGNRCWYHRGSQLALKSQVWGEWKPDPSSHRHSLRDEGAILWAERNWIEEALTSHKRSLVYTFSFSKYKSSKSYDEASGVRERMVALATSGRPIRFWRAKQASETHY